KSPSASATAAATTASRWIRILRIFQLRVAHGLDDLQRLLCILYLRNDDAHRTALEYLLDDPSHLLVTFRRHTYNRRERRLSLRVFVREHPVQGLSQLGHVIRAVLTVDKDPAVASK